MTLQSSVVGGCGSSEDDACGGPRPPIAACARGLHFAECGGSGGAVLACGSGGCLWFTGGCVAAEYRRLECPADSPCCHATADGPWPWREWGAESDTYAIAQDLAMIADQPFTRASPASLTVTVDPELGAPSEVVHECEGEVEDDIQICVHRPDVVYVTREGDSLTIVPDTISLGGWGLVLEVVPQDGGGYVGRAYSRYYADVSPGPERTCDVRLLARFLPGPGTLVLSRFDGDDLTDIHGSLEMGVDEGTLRLRF